MPTYVAVLGMDVDVIVRTAAELDAVLAHDPFEGRATDDSGSMVLFLEKAPPASWCSGLDPLSDKRLGGTSSMRNRRTVAKLAELAVA